MNKKTATTQLIWVKGNAKARLESHYARNSPNKNITLPPRCPAGVEVPTYSEQLLEFPIILFF